MGITQTYYILLLYQKHQVTNILYRKVTKDTKEYIEFHNKDEHGRPIDFNGDVLSFTLHLT